MPKFKAKADAAEHDTGDWEVGAKYYESQSRSQFKPVFFSPGGRIYVTMNNALARLLDEFVRALLPRSTSRRAGRPAGSTPLRVRTVFFFEAVMFLLHCYPHIVLFTPRVVSSSPPSS